jgi:hypothetical protein
MFAENQKRQPLLGNSSPNISIARLWHNKHLSVTAVASHNKRRASADGVFCAVPAEAIS